MFGVARADRAATRRSSRSRPSPTSSKSTTSTFGRLPVRVRYSSRRRAAADCWSSVDELGLAGARRATVGTRSGRKASAARVRWRDGSGRPRAPVRARPWRPRRARARHRLSLPVGRAAILAAPPRPPTLQRCLSHPRRRRRPSWRASDERQRLATRRGHPGDTGPLDRRRPESRRGLRTGGDGVHARHGAPDRRAAGLRGVLRGGDSPPADPQDDPFPHPKDRTCCRSRRPRCPGGRARRTPPARRSSRATSTHAQRLFELAERARPQRSARSRRAGP